MPRAFRASTGARPAKPASAGTVRGSPIPASIARMVAAKVGWSPGVMAMPVAAIDWLPSASTTAWAL